MRRNFERLLNKMDIEFRIIDIYNQAGSQNQVLINRIEENVSNIYISLANLRTDKTHKHAQNINLLNKILTIFLSIKISIKISIIKTKYQAIPILSTN